MLFLILITVLVIILIYFVNQTRKKPPNYPPGPSWLPIVGNLPEFKQLSKRLHGQHLALTHLASEYKTNVLGLKLGNEYVVGIFSYPLVKKALFCEEYEGRPDNFFFRLRCMGQRRGITSTDGEEWTVVRRFVLHHLRNVGFGRKRMEFMIREEIAEVLQIFDNSNGVQIEKVLSPAVLNVLWNLTTGSRIPRNDPLLNRLLELLSIRSKAFDISGGTLNLLPWLRFVAPEWSGYNLIKRINKDLHGMFMGVIEDHLGLWEEGKNDDVIYAFISEMKKAKNPEIFSCDQLITVCLDLFIAGSQTTSSAIDFVFLMMILHPEIQEKVYLCIDEQFPKNHNVEYSDRHKVPYIEAVILEVERFRNVIPIYGPRRALKDTTFESYFIPKNTTVLMSGTSVHFDKDYWTDPEVFRPERFLNEEDGKLVSSEHVIAFGLGRRRCLGEILARNCVFIFFVEIMRKFRISLAPGTKTPTGLPVPGLVATTEYYRVKFTSRN